MIIERGTWKKKRGDDKSVPRSRLLKVEKIPSEILYNLRGIKIINTAVNSTGAL